MTALGKISQRQYVNKVGCAGLCWLCWLMLKLHLSRRRWLAQWDDGSDGCDANKRSRTTREPESDVDVHESKEPHTSPRSFRTPGRPMRCHGGSP